MLHWRFNRRDVQRDLIPSPFNKAKSHNREEIKPLLFSLLSGDLKHSTRAHSEPREQEFIFKVISYSFPDLTPINEPLGGQCVNFPEILEIPAQVLDKITKV